MPGDHSDALAKFKAELDHRTAEASQAAAALERARDARAKARGDLLSTIQLARREGMNWAQIAQALGMTPQGASQFFQRGMAAGE